MVENNTENCTIQINTEGNLHFQKQMGGSGVSSQYVLYRPDLIWKAIINFWMLNLTLCGHSLSARHYRRMKTTFAPFFCVFIVYLVGLWLHSNYCVFSEESSGPLPLQPAFSILIPLIKCRDPHVILSVLFCYYAKLIILNTQTA